MESSEAPVATASGIPVEKEEVKEQEAEVQPGEEGKTGHRSDSAESHEGGCDNEAEGDTKRAKRKRDRQEQRTKRWKNERKRRRTTRKRRPIGGLGDLVAPSEEDSGDGDAEDNKNKEEVQPRKEAELVREGPPPAEGAPLGELSQEEKRQRRALRKEAEIVNFQQRCNAGTTVVLDLEWEPELSDRELKALVQQVLYCYGSNRSAVRPGRLVLSGVSSGTQTLQRLQKLAGFPDAWPGVTILDVPYIEHFASEADKRRLVYLTADTDDVLKTFDQNGVYIIGGIVDHNRLKGSTRKKVRRAGNSHSAAAAAGVY